MKGAVKEREKTEEVALGARIPKELKERMNRFCLEHGLKMNHFVKRALQDKLGEAAEEIKDVAMARERLADAEFITREEYDRYIQRRLGKK
jgi:predicted DNA-binding protein